MKLLHLIKFSKHLSKLPRPSKFTRTGNQWFHLLFPFLSKNVTVYVLIIQVKFIVY